MELSPALEYFQHCLDQAIKDLPAVCTVADDILISGEGDTVQEAVKDHDKKHEPTSRCAAACWSRELPDKILGKAGGHLRTAPTADVQGCRVALE